MAKTVSCFFHLIAILVVLLLLLLAAARPVTAMTAADTLVSAQAEVSYYDPELGEPVRVLSNTASFRVAAVVAVRLEEDQSQLVSPGEQVIFIHRLTQLGNSTDRYQLNLDAGAMERAGIYPYLGALPSPGDPAITETPYLEPGETLELAVIATVPLDAVNGARFMLSLSAVSLLDNNISSENRDEMMVGTVAARLQKSVDKAVAFPGDDLRYHLLLQNTGEQLLPGSQVTIDGEPVRGILLEDLIPLYTRLRPDAVPVVAPVQGKAVVRTLAGNWLSYEQWDKEETVTRIGLFLPSGHFIPGQSALLEFISTIEDNVSDGTQIVNKAMVPLSDKVHNPQLPVVSNEAITRVVSGGAYTRDIVLYFVEPATLGQQPSFGDPFQATSLYFLDSASTETWQDVYLELEGGNFRQSTEVADTVEVTVYSGSNDSVKVLLQETGVNTGRFRSQSPLHLSDSSTGEGVCQSDSSTADYQTPGKYCRLKTHLNDHLLAEVSDPVTQQQYTAIADVSPMGTVFSSDTLKPLAGARVNFIDMRGNIVPDPVTGKPISEQVTDSRGQFSFPRLPNGHFFIQVTPPGGYTFPSNLSPDKLTGKHVTEASYGEEGPPDKNGKRKAKGGISTVGSFIVDPYLPLDAFDIPLDPTSQANSLVLTKTALQPEVAPGEVVAYELVVKNNSDLDLYHLQVTDRLPFGFKYLSGSVRINGEKAPEPAGVPGPQLTFSVQSESEDLAKQDQLTIRYVLQAGAGAVDGDGVNRARASANQAGSGATIYSEEARARIRVKMTGVLSDRAILFGKVYVDSNGDGQQSPGEWPIGGVRIYMEDGTWAITDENGQYSLMGIRPGTHVLRVDPITLPEGLLLKPLDNRNAADGGSRFADVAPGAMQRADFAAECPVCGAADIDRIVHQIKARNQGINSDWLLDEVTRMHRSKPLTQADNSGDLSHGVIQGPPQSPADHAKSKVPGQTTEPDRKGEPLTPDNSPRLTISATTAATMPVTSEVITTVTRQQAEAGTWLWPSGTQADGRFMAVVRGGVDPTLYLNGQAVAADRLGEQLVNQREQAQVLAWYGIPLEEGSNELSIRANDGFGNERSLASGQFTYSGTAVSIKVTPAVATLPADDGRSQLPVHITLLDKQGLPARGVHFVTLESSAGSWLEADIQDLEPGHQVRVEQGGITVHLRSGITPGPVTLRASTGKLRGEAEISQTAAPRPLFAVGMVEVNAGYGQVNSPVPNLDDIQDGYSDHGRGALFIKGEVAKDTQLTLSYDSDKDDTELFRDVDPYDYYPITGDASQQGYEAQSRSKFYGKLEKDRHSLLWGDYQTDSHGSDNNLARIQRNLNGFNGIYDTGITRLEGFASRPENNHLTEIILPDGTAMNYRLQKTPVVRHSETVILETLGRDNPGLVLQSVTLNRIQDYILDDDSGYLRFSQPVLRYDEQGNPRQIRVNYEVEGDGEEYTLAGIRLTRKLGDSCKLGLSYTYDDYQGSNTDLSGAWIEYQPSGHTSVALSAAYTDGKVTDASSADNRTGLKGSALRVKARHRWGNDARTELTWAWADQEFNNSGSGISPGREETTLQHKHPLGERLNLRAEADLSRALAGGNDSTQGDSLGAYLDHRLAHNWQLSAGSRYIRQRSGTDRASYMTGLAGLEKRFQLLSRDASVTAEYEHAVDNNRWRTEVVSDWKLHDKVGLYGRFERDDRLSPVASDTDRNQFALGVKSDWLANTNTYSEYRIRGATNGDSLEWVNGADSRLEITQGLAISPSVEWINTVSGEKGNDGLALSMGLQDKRGSRQRVNGRVEYRHGKRQDYYGLDGAVARRLSMAWSGLLREEFRQESPADPQQRRTRLQALTLGLARRPKLDNRQHGLYLYQWKEEDGMTSDDNRRVHLLSTHQNWQISADQILSGRLGGKWVWQSLDHADYQTRTGLADARWTLDLNRRWDLDLRGGVLAVAGTDSLRWSIGFGLYYLVERNLRIGAWYNAVGFSDKDLDAQAYNAEGIHLSLQFKFDESLFDWFHL